jgi:hypothetical protein
MHKIRQIAAALLAVAAASTLAASVAAADQRGKGSTVQAASERIAGVEGTVVDGDGLQPDKHDKTCLGASTADGIVSTDACLPENDLFETYDGVLIDRESFRAGKRALPGTDLLRITTAGPAVLGVALPQKNGSWKFFQLDGNGQAQASDVLKNYPSGEPVKVTVLGVASAETINVVTLSEKLTERQFAGVLVDRLDFESSKGNPAGVGKESLQSTEKLASGYGVAVKLPDGSYSFFRLDDNSQISAAGIISGSQKDKNITVVAKGVWNGSLLLASTLEAQ